jgi:O-antigen/teichoic acid export membrane protein
VKSPRTGTLVSNAAALIVSGGVSGVIGITFWGVAAHSTSAAVIGRTSAEIAAMTLIAALAQLSFGPTFERFLPVAGTQTRLLVTRAYLICTSVALVLAIIYSLSGLAHSFIQPSFTWIALFVASVVIWTIFALQDSVLVGLRATRWVPVENIGYGLAKLGLIPIFIMVTHSQGIFLAWIAPVIAAIIVVNWYLFRSRIPAHQALNPSSTHLPSIRELISLTGAQYATLLVSIVTSSVVTLIVIDRLGAVANAHYYLPFQIMNGVALFFGSVNRSFLVEASAAPHALRRLAQVALRAQTTVLLPSVVFGVILAPYILRLFGPSYATDGTTLLRMFLLSLPGYAVNDFYTSFAWIDRHVWRLAIRDVIATSIYFIVLFAFIGHVGIVSIGIASLVSSGLQAIFFLPLLVKRYRLTSNTDSPSPGDVTPGNLRPES